MDEFTPRPGDPLTAVMQQDLDPLSVEELHARIALLEAEVARTRARLSRAGSDRSAADALFRK